MEALLSIDLGGSALKAGLFKPDGHTLANASVALTFEEDTHGHSEQNPDIWWEALENAVAAITHRLGNSFPSVGAVSICGFTRTQIFLDEHGEALRPAIGFRDTRSLNQVHAALADERVAEHPDAAHLNPYHPLARLLWLKENEPDSWAAMRLVLEPKDYLNLRLTGQVATDRISQVWLITAFDGGSASLAASAGINRRLLPEILAPWQEVGKVRTGLTGALAQLAGARVFCGCNDTWTAAVGLGALRVGYAYCISGSSEVLGLITSRRVEAQGLMTLSWGDGLWHIGGPGQNGTNVLGWITDCLDPRPLPYIERLEALLALPTGDQPLVFHPFLNGERTPFWDPNLRGAFLGLTTRHGPGDLVRATMEGVGFVNRLVLERAERAASISASEIRIAGGGARNAKWNQIRADILGRPLLASPEIELGLRGGLALARFGLGLDKDITAAADAVAPEFVRFEPNPDRQPYLNELYRLFRDAHETIAKTSHRLAEIGSGSTVAPE